MKKTIKITIILFFSVMVCLNQAPNSISKPELLWSYVGCYSSWCETGWYSSPALLETQGKIVAASYSVWMIDGATGNIEWTAAAGHGSNEPSASSVGRTCVMDLNGIMKPGFPKQVASNEIRSLTVADFNGDGYYQIL
ncbi:hypothetical protein M0811_13685 [Anaeramoeba ignava]|uniref:Uncharacterized protein n=1 Tax=Anaeramoeba ignava TaxID=1746090 RepID=A0A9Q0R545_ANAIG|nr:hypothetical protein M0811_13685 [Anaeramoeba ignava]